ncbi:MAG TPA: hypothetical protein VID70_00800 [Solirubrobacteraceae bacterium]|jgi:hypothetical protein
MSVHHPTPVASAGLLADVIGILGFLAVAAWFLWHVGPSLARVCGWGWWWVAWACGSQGGYWYCLAFLVFGTVTWGGGTLWWARRRGYWPSALSARLFERVLGERAILPHAELPAVLVVPRRRR